MWQKSIAGWNLVLFLSLASKEEREFTSIQKRQNAGLAYVGGGQGGLDVGVDAPIVHTAQ